MVHTTTLIEDHKGQTRPTVIGDEYEVQAHLNITAWGGDSGATIAGDLTDKTLLASSAETFLTDFKPGDIVTLSGATTGANNATYTVDKVDSDLAITMTTAFNTDEAITSGRLKSRDEYVSASELGLSKLNSLEVLAMESLTHDCRPVLTNAGAYLLTNNDAIALYGKTTSSGTVITNGTDIGYVTVKAKGLL